MFFVGGRVDKLGIPQEGTEVYVFDRATGNMLGQGQTNEVGEWLVRSIPIASLVYAYAVNNGEKIKLFDQVTPVTEAFLTFENIFTVNICDPVGVIGPATLQEGGSISGHTIFWEQIDGPAVTIIGGDTLSPTFVNSPVGVSRVFRLTIDQGEIFEQIQEYTVSGRPESINHPRTSAAYEGVNPNAVSSNRYTKIHAVENIQVLPKLWNEDTGMTGVVTEQKVPGATSWWLKWDDVLVHDVFRKSPDFANLGGHNIIGYEVERWNNVQEKWEFFDSIAIGSPTASTLVEGFAYRVCVLWRAQQLIDLDHIQQKTKITQAVHKLCSTPFHCITVAKGGGAELHTISQYAHVFSAKLLRRNIVVSIPSRIFKNPESFNSPRSNYVNFNVTVLKNILIFKGTDGLLGSTASPRFNSAFTVDLVVVRNNGTSIGT